MNSSIHDYFRLLKDTSGSDLHLAAGRPPSMRVHGEIDPIQGEDVLDDTTLRGMMRQIVDDAQWALFEESGDLDFACELEGVARFRGNYFLQENGAGAVFRMIPEHIVSADELGVPEPIRKLAGLESGLVLVTGPTGSGKSTTLASIIDLINREQAKHIVTIEDPVEFVHENRQSVVSHREIGTHTRSFAAALRVALRQDADVVLVGEMRDLETISLALEGASMGVLVFGTLHTSSAAKTVDRIVDAFPADEQAQARTSLGESLAAVVSQLLCRKKDGTGRVAAHEILVRTSGLAGIIREGNTAMIKSIIGSGRGQGMQTMDDTLLALVNEGTIDGHEAYRKAQDKKRFQQWAA